MALVRAERKRTPLKIGTSGPSGSGKTLSALKIAHGITGKWDKIAVIDTENGSASLYAHLGPFLTNALTPPFTPERYIEALNECEAAGIEVIIIDSITHEWDGVGGCLEIQEKLGGRYQDWAQVTPRHRHFIDAILQSPCHVITTVRRKQDYDMSKGDNGKTTVTKVGTKEVTREGFEYELTMNIEIDINHQARASKDRTGLLANRPPFMIDEAFGRELKAWHDSGAAVVVTPEQERARVKGIVSGIAKVKGADVVKAAIAGLGAAKFDELPVEKYPELLAKLS